jgi:hypothetical protein
MIREADNCQLKISGIGAALQCRTLRQQSANNLLGFLGAEQFSQRLQKLIFRVGEQSCVTNQRGTNFVNQDSLTGEFVGDFVVWIDANRVKFNIVCNENDKRRTAFSEKIFQIFLLKRLRGVFIASGARL